MMPKYFEDTLANDSNVRDFMSRITDTQEFYVSILDVVGVLLEWKDTVAGLTFKTFTGYRHPHQPFNNTMHRSICEVEVRQFLIDTYMQKPSRVAEFNKVFKKARKENS